MVQHSNSFERLPFEWLRWEASDGVYVGGGISETNTLTTKLIELKYPAEVGDTWDVINISYSLSNKRFYISDTVKYTLIARDKEFTTPAGRFRCHVYQYSKRPADDIAAIWDYRYYFAPGIGLVGYFAVNQGDSSVIEKSLFWNYDVK